MSSDAFAEMRNLNVMQAVVALRVGEELAKHPDRSDEEIAISVRDKLPPQAVSLLHVNGVALARRWDCPRCWHREMLNRLDIMVAVLELLHDPRNPVAAQRRQDRAAEKLLARQSLLDRGKEQRAMMPSTILEVYREVMAEMAQR